MNINKKQIVISIPLLFIIGFLLHFVFDITGKIKVVGLISPVNESVWEHLKLTFFPIVVWWLLKISNKESSNNVTEKYKSIVAMCVSVILSILTILSFFYIYKGSLRIESTILDIFSLLLGLSVGQLVGYHVFNFIALKKSYVFISMVILIILLILFFIYTFYPPQLPIFKDPITELYGIV